MGGQDKGLVKYQGRPMIEHLLDAVTPQCERVIISCNRNLTRYRAYQHHVVTDTLFPFAGPLSGLLEAMRLCEKSTWTPATQWLALLPVDAPRLPPNHIAWLYHFIKQHPKVQAILPEDKHGIQPLFALISTQSLTSLHTYLSRGERSVKGWVNTLPHLQTRTPDEWGPFVNINTVKNLP